MFKKETYGKVLVPMVTPFKEDQSVDYKAAVDIAKKLIKDNKADSLILTGTTGEFFSMNFEERVKIFKNTKKEVGDKIPLIAGTGCDSTKETIELSKKAEELGFETIMVVAPYYTKPNQEQLYNHYKLLAEEVSINIMLYNIPIFTGVNLSPETVSKLAMIDNIVAIKDEAELNVKQITEFINITPDDFIIYNGDDTMILETYAQGGKNRIGGVVSGQAHLIGKRIKNMINYFLDGDVQKAAEMQQSFLPLFRIMGQNGRINPAALIKDAMRMINYNSGFPRLPLTPGTDKEKEEITKIMVKLNIL